MKNIMPIIVGETKIPRYSRTHVTVEMVTKIVRESSTKSINYLCKKYHLSTRTVKRFIEENPPEILATKRDDLDPLQRTELLLKDSVKVLELTIFTMQASLEAEIVRLKATPGDKPTITVRDLTLFFEAVAPFVMNKVEPMSKKRGEKTPLTKVHSMFVKKSS